MCIFSARLRGLHRNQGGQIAFITVFGAVAIVGLFGMVMTTGDQASQKIEIQNAADAAALSGGSWIARGLNLTSAINVLQTQLIGAAIALQALDETLVLSEPIVIGMCAAYTACSAFVVCIPFMALTCYQADVALPETINAISPIVDFLARCPSGLLWVTARGLEFLNTAIHLAFFAIALAETYFVAQANGADLALLVPGSVFHGQFAGAEFLPTQIAEFPELCDPMEHGSPTREERGYTKLLNYPVGQGPLALAKCRLSWVTAFVTGFPPVGPVLLPFLANLHRDKLCGVESSPDLSPEIEHPARDLAECRRLGGKARWFVTRIDTEPVSDPDGCSWFASHRGRIPPPFQGVPDLNVVSNTSVERRCVDSPPGERLDDQTYCYVELRQQENRSSPPRYQHSLKIWTLERTAVKERIEVDDPPGSGSCGQLPRPYLLRDENDALKFLVVARRANRRIFFSTDRFLEEPPTLYAYAQVEVYSGISADTFNQDWRVRLERAYLLEKPFERLGEHVSGFLDELEHFADLLSDLLPEDGLASLAPNLLHELFNSQKEGDSPTEDEDGESSLRRVLNH